MTRASDHDSSIRKACRARGNHHITHMARVTTIVKVAEVHVPQGSGRSKSHGVLTSSPPGSRTSLGTPSASPNPSTNFWTDVGASAVQRKVPEPSHDQPCGVAVRGASILCVAQTTHFTRGSRDRCRYALCVSCTISLVATESDDRD